MNSELRGVLAAQHQDQLLAALRARGYEVIGPVVRDGVVTLEPLTEAAELPHGYTEDQEGGSYRLRKGGGQACFAHTVGPTAWKRFLHPPQATLLRFRRDKGGFVAEPSAEPAPRRALYGVRPCDLAAIHVQDRVLRDGVHADPVYSARRQGIFVVAAPCIRSAATCFCASLGTGPGTSAAGGYDLALTEIADEGEHRFLVASASPEGEEVARALNLAEARPEDVAAADRAIAAAAQSQGRALEANGLRDLLYRQYESAHFEQVAKRCLACGNCTQVCPTCFCTTVVDHTDLSGNTAERERRWDSCYSVQFSYIHGGSVRTSIAARYRQWLTHKLAAWQDQFGTLGCVGCGRCITWCPVGIDLTDEVRKLAQVDARGR